MRQKGNHLFKRGYSHDGPAVQRGEERVKLPVEIPSEGEDVRFVLDVVERDLALLVVDVYSHLLGHQRERQQRLGVRACVELPCAPPQHPVPFRRLHGEAAVPLRRPGGDSDSPVAVVR